MDLFEEALAVPLEELVIELRGHAPLAWANFFLNPRRLRGSDFLMRWSQGRWSEERLIQAVNETEGYYSLAYGPSGTAPDDPREFELYFERLERAGLGNMKRPDLLLFRKRDSTAVRAAIASLGGEGQLPFTREEDSGMAALLSMAFLGVECENSLWRAARMPEYGSELTPQRRLDGRPGLKKTAVVPTIIIKEQDRVPLREWQDRHRIPIHIWHVFYDMAFGISLDEAERLITKGLIEPTDQVYQAPGGATTRKTIYKIYHHYAYSLGTASSEPTLVADYIDDKNGHILPFVRFQGGVLRISQQAVQLLYEVSR